MPKDRDALNEYDLFYEEVGQSYLDRDQTPDPSSQNGSGSWLSEADVQRLAEDLLGSNDDQPPAQSAPD